MSGLGGFLLICCRYGAWKPVTEGLLYCMDLHVGRTLLAACVASLADLRAAWMGFPAIAPSLRNSRAPSRDEKALSVLLDYSDFSSPIRPYMGGWVGGDPSLGIRPKRPHRKRFHQDLEGSQFRVLHIARAHRSWESHVMLLWWG